MADSQAFDNNNLDDTRNIIGEINDALRASVKELKTQRTLSSDITRDFSNYSKIVDKIKQNTEGLTNLSDEELKNLVERQKILLQQLKDKAKDLDLSKELSEQERALYEASQEEFDLQEEALRVSEEILKNKLELNNALGLGGNILKTTSSLLDKMGASSLNNIINFEKATKEMKEQAELLQEQGRSLTSISAKSQVLFAGVSSIFGDIRRNILDPTVILGVLIKGYFQLDQAATEYSRTTGLATNNITESLFGLETSVEQYKTLGALSKEFGINAGIAFNSEQTKQLTFLVDRLGLSAQQAGKLSQFAKDSNKTIKGTASSVFEQTKQYGIQNKLNINARQVLDDVANTSAATALSLGNSVENITQANLEARKLGLSLQQVEGIADSLLDFQSSIANELEAELLTGKELNLEQARYFALTNDIAGLSKEIGKNQDVINSFSSGNRIEQEAIAKSLGMSRDQIAEMIVQQKMQEGLSVEQAAQMAGISMEQAAQLSTQEKLSKLFEKITAFAGSIAGFILDIVDRWYIIYPLLGVAALSFIPKMASGIVSFGKGIKDSVSSSIELVKNLTKADGLKNIFSKTSPTENISTTAAKPNVADKAGAGAGKGIKSLGDSYSDLGKNLANIAKGAAAVSLIGLSSLLLIPAIPGLLSTAITGPVVAFGLPLLGQEVSALGKMLPQILKGSLALGVLSGAVYLFGSALSTIQGIDPTQMVTFGLTLAGLGWAAAELGLLFEPIVLGSVAIAILSGAIALFGLSLSLVTSQGPGLEQFTKSLSMFTTPETIAGLFSIGPALLSAAGGLTLFSLALGASTLMSGLSALVGNPAIDTLMQLASIAPNLQSVGLSLSMIADSLVRMNAALTQLDLDKLEEIAEIADDNQFEGFAKKITGAITQPLENMSGKGEKGNKELSEIKNILIQILQKEGNVRIDSTKIGTALGMKTYRIQ